MSRSSFPCERLNCCPRCAQPSKPDRKYCSRDCYREARRGNGNPNWNIGQYKSRKGYVFIRKQDHPRASANHGYIQEHILVAEAALGKFLPLAAVVHHINEIKHDNRPCNLVICENDRYHQLLHAKLRVLHAGGDPHSDKICGDCQSVKSIIYFPKNKSRSDGLNTLCFDCARQHNKKIRRANICA